MKKVTLIIIFSLLGNILLASASLNQQVPEVSKSEPVTLFSETFAYPEYTIPTGWTVEGIGQNNWFIRNDQFAGGTAPEMTLWFLPLFSGTSRLTSPVINLEGNQHLLLSFNSKITNYASLFYNDIAGVDISIDEGNTWESIWDYLIVVDQGPELLRFYVQVPENTANLRVAFRFEGDSGNIMEWAFDNVKLQSVLQNDLLARSVIGDEFPVVGEPSDYIVSVVNEGSVMPSSYNVKLINAEGEELTSAVGNPIAFGESTTINLQYTPQQGDIISGIRAIIEFGEDQLPANNTTPELPVYLQAEGTGITHTGNENLFLEEFPGIPFDFDVSENLCQSIYFPEEMTVSGGMIKGFALYNNFGVSQEQPLEIYLGLTEKTQLTEKFISLNTQELVYSGELFLPAGQNTVIIMFDEPFYYPGGSENLLISFRGLPNHTTPFPPSTFLVSETPEYPNRTRSFESIEYYDPFEPEDILYNGDTFDAVPNATFIFDGSGMGKLIGSVTTSSGTSLEGVRITSQLTAANTISAQDGSFRFTCITATEHTITSTLKGYFSDQADIVITEGETSEVEFFMDPLPVISVSGSVTTTDFPETGLANAIIELSGYDQKQTISSSDGSFTVDGVYGEQTYTITVSYEGYNSYSSEVSLGSTDITLENIVLTEKAHPAFNVEAVLDEDQVKLYWEEAGSAYEEEFRYDDGEVDSMFGFDPSDYNTVYGSVHRNWAQLEEISWQLRQDNDGAFPNEFVKLWIVALDENGEPDPQQIVFSAEDIPNINMQWCHYELPQPVIMKNGFFIGISALGHVGIATDDGKDEPYEFQNNTQYIIEDITSDQAFIPFENLSYGTSLTNIFIRAHGWDYGPVSFSPEKNHVSKITPPVYSEQKALQSYSVYRLNENQINDDIASWTQLATGIDSLGLWDPEWNTLPSGIWVYAVVAEYTNGIYSSPAFSNPVPKDMHASVGINVTTNAADAPTGAFITLSNQSGNPEHVYTATVPPSGEVSFPAIWKGDYHISIILEGFHPFIDNGLQITESAFSYNAELVEKISEPYNLFVETEDMETGNALLTWNNSFVGELMEGFEGNFIPEGWLKINPIGGTGWDVLEVGTSPIPGWEDGVANAAPEGGSRMTFVSYQHGSEVDNDQWLVTPKVRAREGYVLSFYLRYWPENFTDNFDIRISTSTQDDYEAFDIIVDTLAFSSGHDVDWALYTYNLNDYVEPGTEVYIAFREFVKDNEFNGAVIMLDNVYVGPPMDRTPVVKVDAQVIPGKRNTDYVAAPVRESKSFEGYNIYLQNMDEPMVTGVNDTEYLFTDLGPGTYQAGVQSVYSTGTSSIHNISFSIEDLADVIFNIKDTEGNDITDAVVTFNEQAFDAGQYIISQINPGMYPYSVSREGFIDVEGEVNVGTDDLELDIVMPADETAAPVIQEDKIVVYPNPAKDVFYIQSSSNISMIRLIDLTGIVVIERSVGDTNSSLPVESLKPGIYLMQIFSDDNAFIKRVMIK